MSLISTAPSRVYPAPAPHGDLQLTGLRGWVARRPLTGFLVIVLGATWLLLSIPVLAFHGVIPGANLPIEVFALASTLLILLPTALWVTWITDGRAGLRALFARVFRWRFGIGWWLVVLFGLPVIALLLGLIFGGSLHTADLGMVLIKQVGLIILAVVVINLWEETVWAGFFQTRLEARFNFVVAAVLTALPFAGVHLPLLLLDDHVSPLSVSTGVAGLLILGIVVRLLMGVTMRGAADSVLAVGVLHQVFDASNNNGALVDSLLDGADAGNITQFAAVILTILVAAWLLWRRPGAFARRRVPVDVSAGNG
jgi:CAAX protease family protein